MPENTATVLLVDDEPWQALRRGHPRKPERMGWMDASVSQTRGSFRLRDRQLHFGQPEIQNLYPDLRQHHVGRFHVAMHEPPTCVAVSSAQVRLVAKHPSTSGPEIVPKDFNRGLTVPTVEDFALDDQLQLNCARPGQRPKHRYFYAVARRQEIFRCKAQFRTADLSGASNPGHQGVILF
jgi:hypothetical protein